MLTTIEIGGNLYHAEEIFDDDYENVVDTIPILDENGALIEASICLCHAYEPSECCCGCTSWGDYRYEDYWEE